YQARWDESLVEQRVRAIGEHLTGGDYPADTLFVLAQRDVERAVSNLDASKDLYAVIDGFHVVAPGWFDCAPCIGAYAGR
ncbi:MAG: hypothetical protein AAFO77_08695, partial [Pseudomonadota bacterium]